MMPNPRLFEYDLFISHASEDKESFVRPLAQILQDFGVQLWYDEFTLGLGDSLSESINRGLSSSRYGLVVISPAFLHKKWTAQELKSLTIRQVDEGNVILPIWVGVTAAEVKEFNLMLSDLVAVRADALSPSEIAYQILKIVNPDLYQKHNRTKAAPSSLVALLEDELAAKLKQKIERTVTSNGRGEITGAAVRDLLLEIVDFASSARKAAH